MLTPEIKQSARESVLCWLATVDADGVPNVSPKEIFLPYGDDELIIANIASPRSVRNLANNDAVCVSFVHVFKQKGFKLVGRAIELQDGDPGYEERHRVLQAMVGSDFPIKSVIQVNILKVQPILAPSYQRHPNIMETTQIANALKTYGVKRL